MSRCRTNMLRHRVQNLDISLVLKKCFHRRLIPIIECVFPLMSDHHQQGKTITIQGNSSLIKITQKSQITQIPTQFNNINISYSTTQF